MIELFLDLLIKWVDLPTKIFVAVFGGCALILLFGGEELATAAPTARAWVLIAFWFLLAFVVVGAVTDGWRAYRGRQCRLNIAKLKETRAKEDNEKRDKARAEILARLEHLNQAEYAIMRNAVVRNAQSFHGNSVRPEFHTLRAKSLIAGVPGNHDEIAIPCNIPDFVWAHLVENWKKWLETETIARLGNGSSVRIVAGPEARSPGDGGADQ